MSRWRRGCGSWGGAFGSHGRVEEEVVPLDDGHQLVAVLVLRGTKAKEIDQLLAEQKEMISPAYSTCLPSL